MNIAKNTYKLMRFFIGLFLVLTAFLVYWQVGVAPQVTANQYNQRQCLPESAPIRGRILDRNGVVLAESTKQFVGCAYTRKYTDPALAPLIGYFAGPEFEARGIEKQFDDVLSGRGAAQTTQTELNTVLHRTTTGNDIYLTIDERIQKVIEKRFKDPYYYGPTSGGETSVRSESGSIIVTDPHTGEMLAWLSQPSYDPNKLVNELQHHQLAYYNQLLKDPKQPLVNRPATGLYVPGSTYKTMTLLAALDSGHTTLEQTFDRQHALGPIYYDHHAIGPLGNNIQDYTDTYPVTTEYGYVHSDNVIFAQLGVNTGLNTWLDYNKRFYIGQQIPFDLPTSISQVLPPGKDTMSTLDLAVDAFGQGTDFVTPLHMSLVADTVANDGQLMRPTLIEKVVAHDGTIMDTFSPTALGNPISSDTASKVRQAMYGVVECGPGTLSTVNIATSPWGLLGKTGTGEVNDNNSVPPHAWFISAGPYQLTNPGQLPALTIVSLRENGGDGGSANGPMIANIYNDVFTQGLVPNQKPTNEFWANYCLRTRLLQH